MYWRIARTYENSFREPVVEDNSHSDKWGLRNLIPVLVVEVQKVCHNGYVFCGIQFAELNP